jgi:membrane protein required for colicin V production
MQQLALTALDYVALGIMLVSALYAMARGLVHETFSIIDWLVAGYGALRLTPVLLPFAQPYVPGGLLQWLAVGLGAFLLIFIPLSIVTGRIANYVQQSPVGAVDRAMGFLFGAGRGLVIVSLAYLAFASLVPEQDQPNVLVKSRLYPVVRDTSQVLRALLPGSESAKRDRHTA